MLVVNLNKEYVAAGHQSTIVTLADAASVGNSKSMESELRKQIFNEGGSYVPLSLGTTRNPIKGWWKMRRLLQKLKPDVIHAHTARALPMLLSDTSSKTVKVLTHHNSHISFPVRMFALFDRIVDAYVAISKETGSIFAQHVAKKIAYIPNAASKSFAAKAPRASISPRRQVISVGTISAQKHYDLLIDTVVELKKVQSSSDFAKFVIAGNGTDLEAMRALARDKSVEDCVEFLGERSDISELMAQSDIYLNTSRYEGMPVALLEAMASGLPIIATRVAGNTELISHEENGLLCPLDDPQALAEGLLRMLSDTHLYRRCSERAIAKSATFSIEATAGKHIELFRELLADG